MPSYAAVCSMAICIPTYSKNNHINYDETRLRTILETCLFFSFGHVRPTLLCLSTV